MSLSEDVTKEVFAAIDEFNLSEPQQWHIEKDLSAVLLGDNGTLDSLGFVMLIVALERRLEEKLGQNVSLTDEKAISQQDKVFRTVGDLIAYICTLIDNERTCEYAA
ncbi:MAG: acyl carrier protein [Candidatus Omnitrophica bacterium]|nr:acyl carrier protein [Candidatus Omnitrophota bacterium]